MFKLTLFLDKKPQELLALIEPIGFKANAKGEITWRREELFFTLVPFSEKARGYNVCGYRALFNTTPEGTIHLLKLFSPYQPTYRGLEYAMTATRSKQEWIRYFSETNGFKVEDPRGIFSQKDIGIIVLADNHVILQVRPEKPKGVIKLKPALFEIEELAENIHPKKYDLFSMMQEEAM
ncbi:hypothetical protein [Pseudobacillus badius]|uniref:hypothetical protein n=1 Tax=Bacillus badius TaxID=1455 RepID=UPI003D32CAA8